MRVAPDSVVLGHEKPGPLRNEREDLLVRRSSARFDRRVVCFATAERIEGIDRQIADTVTFNIDDVGPGVIVTGSPGNGQTDFTGSASLSFFPSPPDEPSPFRFQCRFDSAAAFTPCTNFVQGGLPQGQHILRVRAIDRFGNIGSVTEHSWTVVVLG